MAETCPHCDGTGWKPVDRDGVHRVVRCDCWHQDLAGKLLTEARIQPRYRNCELENFVIYPNEKLREAVEHARRFADAYPTVERGLCFVGPHGVGKTHLAVAILKKVVRQTNAKALFWDTTDLLREIRNTYDPSVRAAEMSILRPVMEAQLLVLDDIGKDRFSEWVEETMNLIINTRYNQRLLTVFTSNFEDDADDTNLRALKVRVGTRVHSRMHEMCRFVEFDGADYRFKPQNAGPDDLVAMWKNRSKDAPASKESKLKALKAQLKPPRELGWSGGKAGS
jgi:DNA replication protein DnaC